MIEPVKFTRRTFSVEGIQVTNENISDAAEWCGGSVETDIDRLCVTIVITRGRNTIRTQRTKAYIGDWITRLSAGNSPRVYRNGSFEEAFDPAGVSDEKHSKVFDLIRAVLVKQGDVYSVGEAFYNEEAATNVTDEIVKLFK